MPILQDVAIVDVSNINYFAVILAAFAYMLLGILWYSPILFGSRIVKYDDAERYEENPKSLFATYFGEAITSFVIANGLAFFIAFTKSGAYGGMILALLVWICFVATTHFSAVLWSRKSVKNFCIHSGFTFIGFILMGLILGLLT